MGATSTIGITPILTLVLPATVAGPPPQALTSRTVAAAVSSAVRRLRRGRYMGPPVDTSARQGAGEWPTARTLHRLSTLVKPILTTICPGRRHGGEVVDNEEVRW